MDQGEGEIIASARPSGRPDGHAPGLGACAARCARRRRRPLRRYLGPATLALALALAAPALAAEPAWELTAIHAPTNVLPRAPVNAVFTITVSAVEGKYRLHFENPLTEKEAQTKRLRFDATAAEVQEALEKPNAIGEHNVKVTGGPGDEHGTKPYLIEFTGALGGIQIPDEDLEVSQGLEASAAEEKEHGKEEGTVALALTTAGYREKLDYELIPRNIGGAPTEGQVIVTDKLPAGVITERTPEGAGWKCTPMGAGQTSVQCKSETAPAQPVANPDGDAHPILIEATLDTGTMKEGDELENEATVSGGHAPSATAKEAATVTSVPAPFGVHQITAGAFGVNGETYTQAAGHPYAATTSFFFNTTVSPSGEIVVPGNVKDINVRLPEGFVGNPLAGERCTQAEFTQSLPGGPNQEGLSCKPAAQVGAVVVLFNGFGGAERVPVYDLAPPPGAPAEFGFLIGGVPIRVDAHVVREPGKDGTYRLTVLSPDISEAFKVFGIQFTLWGVPADESHKAERLLPDGQGGAPAEHAEEAFLTNPVDCLAEAEPPTTTISVDRWERPGQLSAQGEPILSDPNWPQTSAASPLVTGCNLLRFEPSIGFAPLTTRADEPSGYKFSLEVPQSEAPGALATPELKDTTVTLPEGVSISPSAANGLQACSESEIGLESTQLGSCPLASQVGEATIKSQLLEKPLEGRVYIGQPLCSPCTPADAENGKLVRLFIEAEGAGVRIKLPGTASVNTATGRLTTTFKNNPQLPFEKLELKLKNGPRAPLANPQACGSYTMSGDLTPWSLGGTTSEGGEIPGTPDATPSSAPFSVDWNGAGEGCPASVPFSPGFAAGTENSKAGEYSSFDVTFERKDREQDLSGITVQTPPGLLGKIAGIVKCEGPAAESAECPAASRIATATSAAGAGPDPFVVSGPVYLTGPYKGAPFGLSIAVPANAGPFHLGTVVVRAAISVNPQTAALTITSNPLPQRVDGVPLRLKVVKVDVDRPEFMFNPTNCEAQSIGATVTGEPVKAGEAPVSVQRSVPFIASSCGALSFNPTFTASTEAKTSKAGGASLSVKIEQKQGEPHIHKLQLQLPLALPSRLTTLQKACTAAQFASNPAGCPEYSVVGTATALTPLLNVPLAGPGYLVSHGGAAFPDLVFLLQGEGVQIELVGHTDIKKGITYSRFETVPDAPISSFETSLPEGPHSILAAYGVLCEKELLAPTKIVAQNNMQVTRNTRIAVTGCPPSLAITNAKVKGNALLVTVKLSKTKTGTVKITGTGLKSTVKRGLKAGAHQISVPLSKAGKAATRHHKKIHIQVSLTVGSQTATKTANVKA